MPTLHWSTITISFQKLGLAVIARARQNGIVEIILLLQVFFSIFPVCFFHHYYHDDGDEAIK